MNDEDEGTISGGAAGDSTATGVIAGDSNDEASKDDGQTSGATDAEGTGEASPTGTTTGDPPSAKSVQVRDWRDRRIEQLTARNRELQAQLTRNVPDPETAGREVSPQDVDINSDIERLAEAKANEKLAIQRFNDQCNGVVEAGNSMFGAEFMPRVNAIRGMIDPTSREDQSNYTAFLSAAIDTGDAPRLLHYLGGNLEEASRIMSLSPTKMAVELTKLAVRPTEELSRVPKPITPIVGGRQAAHTAIDPRDTERADNLNTAEWMRRREEQVMNAGRRR